jgi:hypothetical protein
MILKDFFQSKSLAWALLYGKDIDVPSKQLLSGIPHEEPFFVPGSDQRALGYTGLNVGFNVRIHG